MRHHKIPKFLQPYLWSVPVHKLDLKKHKIYIVHQILAFGDLEALRWLTENYRLKDIQKVFLGHPMKIYRKPAFYFAKNIILDIKRALNQNRYVEVPLWPSQQSPAKRLAEARCF